MGKSGLLSIILAIVAVLAIGALVFYFFFSQSKIDQLTRALNETKQQVMDVKKESDEAKKETAMTAMEGMRSTADAIKDVQNPQVRLALIKAYAETLRPLLTSTSQKDLDTILVYVNGNPKVLVTKNPTLPKDVVLAINNLKTRARNLKIAGIATMQKIDKELYTQNEVVNLTGTIAFVEDDPALGGSVFTLTDSETGYVYYLVFNETNSETIKNSMLNKEVNVTVKVTSKANEPLTFQVVKGPTLAKASNPAPASSAQSSPAPTTTP